MYISNYINGQNVQDTDMNNEYTSLEHTTNFFNNIIPCVYYGNTAVSSGLNVTVLAGEGRAKDVIMSWLNYTNPLMIEYNVIETVLAIPANSTGFIVVNSNINNISVGGSSYTITDTIQFVTSLTPSFPSGTLVGQVPLYSVSSTSILAIIIDICTRLSLYNPDIVDSGGAVNIIGPGGLIVDYSMQSVGSITAGGDITASNASVIANGAGNIVTTGSGNIATTGSGQIFTANANITANGIGSIVTTGSGSLITSGTGNVVSNNGIQSINDIHCVSGQIYTNTGANGGSVLWHDGRISAVSYYGNNAAGRPVFPGAGTGNNNAAVIGDLISSPYDVLYSTTIAIISPRNDGKKNITICGRVDCPATGGGAYNLSIPISVWGLTTIVYSIYSTASAFIGPSSYLQEASCNVGFGSVLNVGGITSYVTSYVTIAFSISFVGY